AHGGRIAVASDGPGRGATFRVELSTTAAAPAAEPQPRAPAPDDGPQGRRARILLAEDNAETLKFLALILRRRGFRVLTAASLAQAQEAVAGEVFDLVVSDLELGD